MPQKSLSQTISNTLRGLAERVVPEDTSSEGVSSEATPTRLAEVQKPTLRSIEEDAARRRRLIALREVWAKAGERAATTGGVRRYNEKALRALSEFLRSEGISPAPILKGLKASSRDLTGQTTAANIVRLLTDPRIPMEDVVEGLDELRAESPRPRPSMKEKVRKVTGYKEPTPRIDRTATRTSVKTIRDAEKSLLEAVRARLTGGRDIDLTDAITKHIQSVTGTNKYNNYVRAQGRTWEQLLQTAYQQGKASGMNEKQLARGLNRFAVAPLLQIEGGDVGKLREQVARGPLGPKGVSYLFGKELPSTAQKVVQKAATPSSVQLAKYGVKRHLGGLKGLGALAALPALGYIGDALSERRQAREIERDLLQSLSTEADPDALIADLKAREALAKRAARLSAGNPTLMTSLMEASMSASQDLPAGVVSTASPRGPQLPFDITQIAAMLGP